MSALRRSSVTHHHAVDGVTSLNPAPRDDQTKWRLVICGRVGTATDRKSTTRNTAMTLETNLYRKLWFCVSLDAGQTNIWWCRDCSEKKNRTYIDITSFLDGAVDWDCLGIGLKHLNVPCL